MSSIARNGEIREHFVQILALIPQKGHKHFLLFFQNVVKIYLTVIFLEIVGHFKYTFNTSRRGKEDIVASNV